MQNRNSKAEESTSVGSDAKLPVSGSGLPIHATNKDNTYTFCGLKVTPDMSFHRGGIMLGMIIRGEKFACNGCLSYLR